MHCESHGCQIKANIPSQRKTDCTTTGHSGSVFRPWKLVHQMSACVGFLRRRRRIILGLTRAAQPSVAKYHQKIQPLRDQQACDRHGNNRPYGPVKRPSRRCNRNQHSQRSTDKHYNLHRRLSIFHNGYRALFKSNSVFFRSSHIPSSAINPWQRGDNTVARRMPGKTVEYGHRGYGACDINLSVRFIAGRRFQHPVKCALAQKVSGADA